MPNHTIRAVIFDLGGTLEDTSYNDALRAEAAHGLRRLMIARGLDPRLSAEEVSAHVAAGMDAYTRWREQTEIELPPEQVWAEYVFPDRGLPKEELAAAAEELIFFYETHFFRRSVRPEATAALQALAESGYRLAVISNIISRSLVPIKLAEYGIAHFFDPILTSSNFGWRKPNERIFLECARQLDLPPAACAYVGDTISRDVSGARRAGYGLAIQIKSFLTDKADRPTDVEPPDAVIHHLTEVVDLVTRPPLPTPHSPLPVRGIFFDAADVFYARRESTMAYAVRLLREQGYPAQMSAEDAARHKMLRHQASNGQVSAESYWDTVLRMYGVTAAAERAVLCEQISAQADEVYALPDAAETVQALKARGFILSVITDTIFPIERKLRWLKQIGVAEFVDHIACSTELGVHKPDPAIYLAALRQAGLTAAESAFVGHDTAELTGARAVGLRTVAVFYGPDAQADYYAESLAELLDVPIFKR